MAECSITLILEYAFKKKTKKSKKKKDIFDRKKKAV